MGSGLRLRGPGMTVLDQIERSRIGVAAWDDGKS
jgi:hypothetical protein